MRFVGRGPIEREPIFRAKCIVRVFPGSQCITFSPQSWAGGQLKRIDNDRTKVAPQLALCSFNALAETRWRHVTMWRRLCFRGSGLQAAFECAHSIKLASCAMSVLLSIFLLCPETRLLIVGARSCCASVALATWPADRSGFKHARIIQTTFDEAFCTGKLGPAQKFLFNE